MAHNDRFQAAVPHLQLWSSAPNDFNCKSAIIGATKMQRNRFTKGAAIWPIITSTIGFSACASAQDIAEGKTQYQSSCAACHGIDAKGDGPVSTELKTRPADLTVLAKNNNGVFPYDMVY
jgi:cytochrome c1